jgi:hypothetical protein
MRAFDHHIGAGTEDLVLGSSSRLFQASMELWETPAAMRAATTKQEGVASGRPQTRRMSSTFPALTLVLLLAVIILIHGGRSPEIAA